MGSLKLAEFDFSNHDREKAATCTMSEQIRSARPASSAVIERNRRQKAAYCRLGEQLKRQLQIHFVGRAV
jgi:hypothetical protein